MTSHKKRTYDAIVVGSGISGGWAAKELCEKGLKTLVLERGRPLEHIKDYTTAMTNLWEFPHHNWPTQEDVKKDYPIQSVCYAFNEGTRQMWAKDTEHPYTQVKPFDWIKGYHVGGKSLMWARQTYRWAEFDFESNLKDGHGADWPIRYQDIAPWYSYVEKFAGINGNRDGLPQIPDGEFLPPMELTILEKHLQETIRKNFPGRTLVHGRSANITQSINGRTPCQYRSLCHRGCPFGAYFSSNGVTLPAAEKTGKMTLRPYSIVESVIFDEKTGKATGVRVMDAQTKEVIEYKAKIIFLNAGTLPTTQILLNSKSDRFPGGLGNDSGVLGHYLMDHNYRARVGGEYDGFHDHYHKGRRPVGVYIPRFRNFGSDKQTAFVRGYAFGGGADRGAAFQGGGEGFGADFKTAMTKPGGWGGSLFGMGECLPHFDNKVTLNTEKRDAWGMPTLDIDCQWRENEDAMVKDILQTGQEMLEAAGFKNIWANDSQEPPGRGIHEMGTARMGRDPKTSMLNGNNQLHAVPNVFVTDGSCMASGAAQNPSITYMALTARAVDFAVKELKKRNL
ncbi:MAG TPA: GMC family oxidoreductase [Saprospiraceae bacterium]|nr:GMC family oxidoreductase [Saprospiraceae bacterium]HPI05319.1 GMC family oxidoreductase [Saprospiraceae bacterium]